VPSAHLHPEFGCLCPSPRLRRRIWAVAAFLVFGSFAGANAILSLADEERMADATPAAARNDAARIATAPDDGKPVVATTVVAKTLAVRPLAMTAHATKSDTLKSEADNPAAAPPDLLRAACQETIWSYLDGKCISGNAQKLRTVNVPGNRATNAAADLGRAAAPSARPPGAVPDARASSPLKVLPATATSMPVAAASGVARPASAPNRAQTVAQVRADGARAPAWQSGHPQGHFGFFFSPLR